MKNEKELEEISKLVNTLRTDQIEKLLLARQYHCEKFKQIKVGMIFTSIAGFDDAINEIVEIDLDMMCFLYKDISIEQSKIKCSKMFFIPDTIFLNIDDLVLKCKPFVFRKPDTKTVNVTFDKIKK